MSEQFLGEAFVRIRPDTTTFATELKADVVAAAAAASASATASARKAASAAKEAGVSVRNLATATTALTRAQNANKRAADKAAFALAEITNVTSKLAIAQERATRATQVTIVADRAVEKSKLAVASAEKALVGAIAAGNTEVLASVEKSVQAARGALALAEANQAAAASHELKAKAAINDAKAEQTAAAATTSGLKGNVAAAAAAAAARSRGVVPPLPGAAGTKAGAEAGKAAAASRELRLAQNLQVLASSKLAFANREVAITTTAMAAAQEVNRRSTSAVAAAEKALDAALALKNKELITSATLTLDDARAKQKDAIASVNLAEADTLHLTAVDKLENVTRKVAGVTSELAAAQIRASRASTALTASEEALDAALATGNKERIIAAQDTNALAIAQEREALAALDAAKSQQLHSSQLAFARRGALASVLSMVGLRGATLAANSAFIAGAAALIAFAKSLSVFTRFETQLNVFQVTTGAAADEMQRVSETAVQLGADITLPGVSAGDAAEAMTELAKAGLSVQDAISGARGVLQLATAANISNADATQLAASALNAFGLSGDQAVRVADVLANAANAAQGSISDMGLSLQQAAAVGRQVGFSLEDTTVLLTSLTRAGIRGSDAGTSLRTALLRLINPTKKIKAVFDELGLSLRDSEGNLRPDFFVNLGIALDGLSKKQRDAKLAILGGADAIRSLSILSRQSIGDLIGLRKEIRNQGTAAEVAAARTQGLAGAGKALQNTLENIGLSIGGAVGPGLENFAQSLNVAIAAIGSSQSVKETLGDTLGIVGSGFQALGTVLTTIGPPALGLVGILQQVTSSIGVAEILGAVAAYKLLPPALAAAKSAYAAFTVQVELARVAMIKNAAITGETGALSALRLGLRSAATSFAAFATSASGIGIGVALLAGGLIFLATRESAAEQATRHLKDATDALQGSMSALTTVTGNLARATSGVTSNELGLRAAQLAAAQAQQALANSTAAKGTLERSQLENALAIALDNVRLAEERLVAARKEQAQLTAEQQQAEINLNADRAKETKAVNDLTEAIRIQHIVQQDVPHVLPGAPREREAEAVDDFVKKLRERADVEAAVNTEASRALAKRLRAIASLAQETGKLPTEHVIDVLIRTPNLKAALGDIVRDLATVNTAQKQLFVVGKPQGLLDPGNLDVLHRKTAQLGEGWSGTVRSMSFALEDFAAGNKKFQDILKQAPDAEVLIPTIIDGKALKGTAEQIERQAKDHFIATGEHLGIFTGVATANAYADALHLQQASLSTAASDVLGSVGDAGVKALVDAILGGLVIDPQQFVSSFNSLLTVIAAPIKQLAGMWTEAGTSDADLYWAKFTAATRAATIKVTDAVAAVIATSTAKINAIDRQALDLEIAGASPQAILANLQAKRAEQEKVVARQERRFKQGDIAIESVTKAKEDLAETVGKIRSLQKSIADDAETARKDIQSDRDKADQAVIDAFTGKRTRLENLLTRAGGNEGLGDDIKFNKALVALLRKQIKLAGDRIKNLEKRRDFIRDTNKQILAINNQIKDDQKKQKDLIKQKREDRQTEIGARIDADIEFAQIKENVSAEIRARQARIRFLRTQQQLLVKEKGQRAKNTAAYKDLRNQIASENKAIADLRGEQGKSNDEAQKMIFEFLQKQSGFAANLLSNLIPIGAVGGTVGGTTPVAGTTPKFPGTLLGGAGAGAAAGTGRITGIDPLTGRPLRESGGVDQKFKTDAAIKTSGAGGPTRIGQSTELQLLHQILHVLQSIHRGTAHPEAKHRQHTNPVAFDISHNV